MASLEITAGGPLSDITKTDYPTHKTGRVPAFAMLLVFQIDAAHAAPTWRDAQAIVSTGVIRLDASVTSVIPQQTTSCRRHPLWGDCDDMVMPIDVAAVLLRAGILMLLIASPFSCNTEG
ncbi:hypothetical protein [Yoonia sp.]|uniref:hypothetical protein n=1 Tax=Yoonia sp. TaxID=2212373 RepID=UPI003976682C